jgi:hypothetical protein
MHRADVIYSGHGAQLSSLIYIRPCTTVVEFFPAYYVQFFQSLVVPASGLSYEENANTNSLNGIDRVNETAINILIIETSKGASIINFTPDFFLLTFPELMRNLQTMSTQLLKNQRCSQYYFSPRSKTTRNGILID